MDSLGKPNPKTSIPEDVKYPCKDGTLLYTKEGNRAEGDKKIFIKFPKNPWMPSIECLLAWIRMKSWLIEDNNYKRQKGYRGKGMLHDAIQHSVWRKDLKIREICKKFKIPGF